MKTGNRAYRAMISTDWNECLAPSGPFDPFTFSYPQLSKGLERIFRAYTGNEISLGQAVETLLTLVPAPLTAEQMDEYLDCCFSTYQGVCEFMRWCSEKGILFMINTTGTIGYFQRVLAKGLIPEIDALSALSMLIFSKTQKDPRCIYPLKETTDKARNTETVARLFDIPTDRIVIIGDSGGDGPHFEWGAKAGCHLIGSMTKASLQDYCDHRSIKIDVYFGVRYQPNERRNLEKEMSYDFTKLEDIISKILKLS